VSGHVLQDNSTTYFLTATPESAKKMLELASQLAFPAAAYIGTVGELRDLQEAATQQTEDAGLLQGGRFDGETSRILWGLQITAHTHCTALHCGPASSDVMLSPPGPYPAVVGCSNPALHAVGQ
jgi:hypothetical protein